MTDDVVQFFVYSADDPQWGYVLAVLDFAANKGRLID